MARSAEQILKTMLGEYAAQIAILQSQVEQLTEENESLKKQVAVVKVD